MSAAHVIASKGCYASSVLASYYIGCTLNYGYHYVTLSPILKPSSCGYAS